ncbi:helicase-related protein [Gordonia paraffinivorans]|uniref:helicase-related protein n=1 Tax=Gordonia paraffinivorans TaxID=175628 RepID=UPI001447B037|nr:helicase-related protein [Gordonia paraffinivorans]
MKSGLNPWYEARDALAVDLEEELMGPREPLELDEPPLNRIIVGVLHPRRGVEEQEFVTGLEEEQRMDSGADVALSETEEPDSAVALSRAVKPTSIGLTFAVAVKETPAVRVRGAARRYISKDPKWVPVDVTSPDDLKIDVRAVGRGTFDFPGEKLRLMWVVRRPVDGLSRITVSLVNTAAAPSGERMDAHCWFRPSIEVAVDSGLFVDRRRTRPAPSGDRDIRSNDFLYRNEPALAVGHGCAVEWDGPFGVTELSTTFMPSHDVRLARPSGGDENDEFGTYELDMERLASDTDTSQLRAMADAYRGWIDTREREALSMTAHYRETALEHIEYARSCERRIRAGIDLLESKDDPDVARAFRLMNEAMVEQRKAQDRARGVPPSAQRWRPFQMAFILMNLPALASEAHEDRDVVDLLWFPTGGGKTEAYLGCIGFVILLRRLRRADDGGVSAIMRYTLRLLTRQQFERAAGLICALELIRRRELPAATPISLGLWVGDKASPNKVTDAKAILNKMAAGEQPEGSTPVQLLRCPWCAAPMGHRNYEIVSDDEMRISCGESRCEFSDGLPLYVTDDDVYRVKPSLLIGTVDKFALMAWREEVGLLLSVDGPHSRPDLIVQDELHLISGPLGTMVGLYESALDLACTGQGRPKVLASTATIRRAEQQVQNVFNRRSVQFPPPGLDPADNYFAVDATPGEKGTRRYVGIMAPGISQATLLVRIYSALLQSARELDCSDEVRDQYWTLLGYFNSLRVLGSTYLQVLDDVPNRIAVLAERRGTSMREISQEPIELTSRVDQTRIPEAMSALETRYPSRQSPDVVLATNMISVGLDIDRLGLMVVAGQPQSTSEYIQSTSRVGRRNPGLVVVAFNGQRSRDISHYESFIPFHRALYREVEATTATPFAARARDRGAHGTLVAAVRMLIPGLRADRSAPMVSQFREDIEAVIAALVARAAEVSTDDESRSLRAQLEDLVNRWQDAVAGSLVERYGSLRPPRARPVEGDHPLLTTVGGAHSDASSFPVRTPPWPTLSSMRDVDAETNLYVKYLKESDV